MNFETWFEKAANQLPLEIFTAAGGFIEEIIAPIPSPLIMGTAGSAAFHQGKDYFTLFYLAVLGSAGKTAASWAIYLFGEKAEHLAVGKFGKWFGVTQESMDRLSKIVNKGWKDFAALLMMRSLPFFPSSVVSLASGILRVEIWTYMISTFIGNIIRGGIFLYIGYEGNSAYRSVIEKIDSAESIVKVAIVGILIGAVVWFRFRKRS